jgi:hypothetical protein
MDPELAAAYGDALLNIQQGQLRITNQATMLLFVLISSMQDDPTRRIERSVVRDVQRQIISNLPQYIGIISHSYNTQTVDALMVLNFMPRFMSEFCPPFKNPPPY